MLKKIIKKALAPIVLELMAEMTTKSINTALAAMQPFADSITSKGDGLAQSGKSAPDSSE